MLQCKCFLVFEKFENECLPKIVPASFGKVGYKRTLDSPWKLPKANAKKRGKLSIWQDALVREVNRGLVSFCSLCKVRKPLQNSCLM